MSISSTALISLNNQIRGALADNAEKPRYIETLPRRGYRFIAAVQAASKGPKPAEIAAIVSELGGCSDGVRASSRN